MEEVLSSWAGLGYYARARNLHACAQRLAREGFPGDVDGLLALPGVGAYTAAAIGSIAFGRNVIPIDGNVERVVARLFSVTETLPEAKKAIARHVRDLASQSVARLRPSDTTQSLFDLGATVCVPAQPKCNVCPLQGGCLGYAEGTAAGLPRKPDKKMRPHRFGVHFWLQDHAGRVLLRRRPHKGLLGGMTELPGTEWRTTPWGEDEARAVAPMPGSWRPAGRIEHGFTHFTLSIDMLTTRVPVIEADGFLCDADALGAEALPSVMRKCVKVVQRGALVR